MVEPTDDVANRHHVLKAVNIALSVQEKSTTVKSLASALLCTRDHGPFAYSCLLLLLVIASPARAHKSSVTSRPCPVVHGVCRGYRRNGVADEVNGSMSSGGYRRDGVADEAFAGWKKGRR